MNKDIIKLCEKVLKNGSYTLGLPNCKKIKCKECPFSGTNNNGVCCGNDSEEHYRIIAYDYTNRSSK